MPRPEALSLKLRHGYGLTAVSLSMANTAVLFLLLKFLVDEAGLSPALAGSVLLVGKAWDAVSDPIVGRLSDRTTSAMGARRPWLLGGVLPWALLFTALWVPIPLEGTAKAAAYALLLLAYNTAYTAIVVPYGALTPALTDDYDGRTQLNGARMTWSMLGGLISGLLMPWAATHWGFPVAGALIGVLMIPPVLVTLYVTRGRDRHVQASSDEGSWSVLRVRAFRRVAVLFVAAWTNIAILSALVPFYVHHQLRQPERTIDVLAAIQLSALAAVPLAVFAGQRFEKHVAYAWLVGSWALAMLAISMVPEGDLSLALGIALCTGPGVAAAHVLPWSILPDVVDADARQRGADRAGAFYGVMTFLEKSATAVALWGLGVGLGAAGYVEGAEVQGEAARFAIRVLIGPVPGVVLLAAAVFALWAPPLTRAEHAALVEGGRSE